MFSVVRQWSASEYFSGFVAAPSSLPTGSSQARSFHPGRCGQWSSHHAIRWPAPNGQTPQTTSSIRRIQQFHARRIVHSCPFWDCSTLPSSRAMNYTIRHGNKIPPCPFRGQFAFLTWLFRAQSFSAAFRHSFQSFWPFFAPARLPFPRRFSSPSPRVLPSCIRTT